MSDCWYFVSDLHLGIPNASSSRQREQKLVRWLNMAAEDASEIFIVGDLFDFWFEYRKAVPKGYTRLLGTLSTLCDKGIRIHLFRGNHDMWMFDYLPIETGVLIHSDELILESGGKRFFLHHGDGLGPGDPGYKRLRKLFRNRWAQQLFRFVHPDIGIRIAGFFSRRSRLANLEKGEPFEPKTEWLLQFCTQMQEQGQHHDYYIFGHRHLRLDLDLPGNSRYINLGEWVSGNTYAKWDGEELQLNHFE